MAATKSNKPARKRTRKPAETVTFSSVKQTCASKSGRNADKLGKQMRGYIRSHDAQLRESFGWPPESKAHADGNRYPDLPRAAADALIERFGAKKS
jgi:hypothetical protein